MANKIQADYDELARASSVLFRHGDSTEQLLRQLRQMIDRLQNGSWEGVAADAFFSQMQLEILPAVQRLIAALEYSREAVVKISDLMQQTEYEAGELLRREQGLTNFSAQDFKFAGDAHKFGGDAHKFGGDAHKFGGNDLKFNSEIKFGNNAIKFEGQHKFSGG
jgi:WXG100 family type VII secretion target